MKINGKDSYLALLKGEKGDKGQDGAGVYINGVATDVHFTSDPQSQLNELKSKNKTMFFSHTGNFANTSDFVKMGNNVYFKTRYGGHYLGFECNQETTEITFSRPNYDAYTSVKFTGLKPNTTYTLSFNLVAFSITNYCQCMGVRISNDSTIGVRYSYQIAINENGEWVSDDLTNTIWFSNTGDSFTISQFQLEEGNVATDYEAYKGEIIREGYFYTRPQVTAGTTIIDNDVVIESYISSDGLTWYRKWASGWKECGGSVAEMSSGTYTLPIAFSNTNYTITTSANKSGDNYYFIRAYALTEQTIDVLFKTRGGADCSAPFMYECSGY